MAKKKAEATDTSEGLFDVVFNGEQILPEAPASINIKINWNGGDGMLTMRDLDENNLLDRLIAFLPALEEQGVTIAGRAKPTKAKSAKAKSAKAKPKAKGTPNKAEPDVVDEKTIEITSIYIKEGKRGNYAFVKGKPGFEKDGAICYDDAWQNSDYDLQEQEPDNFYEPADFGFVRAVLRFDGDGKPRVWRFLTEREKIPF